MTHSSGAAGTPGRGLQADALVLDPDAYRAQRPERRAAMIPLRAARRVRLGDTLALEFENADTLQYQVQEMLHVEWSTSAPPAQEVAHELEAYGRMLPTSHELCATLFLEFSSLAEIRPGLVRLSGIQDRLSIEVAGERVPGYELPGLDETEEHPETVAVHVVRFRFTDSQRDAFRDPDAPAALAVDHEEYSEETPLTGDTRRSLLADLAL